MGGPVGLHRRNHTDSGRAVAPLRRARTRALDTSGFSLEETVDRVAALVEAAWGQDSRDGQPEAWTNRYRPHCRRTGWVACHAPRSHANYSRAPLSNHTTLTTGEPRAPRDTLGDLAAALLVVTALTYASPSALIWYSCLFSSGSLTVPRAVPTVWPSSCGRQIYRSHVMARVSSRDTRPELALRRFVFGLGYRYRLHVAKLPGTPDMAFPSWKAVIFLHGCFWHRHDCRRGDRLPITNRAYWPQDFAVTKREMQQTGRLYVNQDGVC